MCLAGGCENQDSLNCIEVFNTKTQTWNHAGSKKQNCNLRNMERRICTRTSDKSGYVTKPKDWTMETVGLYRDLPHRSVCIIDKIFYVYKPIGVFECYNPSKVGVQSILLEGLEGLPKFADYSTVKLEDYGGNMMVLWDTFVPESDCKEKMIWCAEISLEKCGSKKIWGKVEWFDVVLTVPSSYKFVYATTATV